MMGASFSHDELQRDADAIDNMPAPGRLTLTLAVVQRVVGRGARAARGCIATRPEDAPGVLELHVGCLRPLDSSRDLADVWSRWGAYDGATQGWAGVMVPRGGCPTSEHAELYSAHWGFAAAVVQRVRSE